jgi:hypothetical protein
MANTTIPNLPLAISLDGTEQLEIVQAGTSKRTTTGAVAGLTTLVLFPPLLGAPGNPLIGQAYFDLTLGYPLIFCADLTWHGFLLS